MRQSFYYTPQFQEGEEKNTNELNPTKPQTCYAPAIESVDVVLFSRLFDYLFSLFSVWVCPSQPSVCNLIILYFDVLALVFSDLERTVCCIVVSTWQPCQLLSVFPATISIQSRFFSLFSSLFLLFFYSTNDWKMEKQRQKNTFCWRYNVKIVREIPKVECRWYWCMYYAVDSVGCWLIWFAGILL